MQIIKEIFQPTVAGALAQFKASALKLERVTAHHTAKADSHDAVVARARFKAAAARTEAEYATELRTKFSSIFGV